MLNQAQAHWSKDFVEHLRTVHFALAAVAIGLIVLVLSSKGYNAVSALVQIEQITKLEKEWSLAWFKEHGRKSGAHVPRNRKDRYPAVNIYNFFEDTASIDSPNQEGFVGQIFWGSPEPAKLPGTTLDCSFPENNWFRVSHTNPNWSPIKFPETVAGFTVWWNYLRDKSFSLYIPKSIYQSANVNNLRGRTSGTFVVGIHNFDDVAKTPRVTVPLSFSSTLDKYEDEALDRDDFYYYAHLQSQDESLFLEIPITTLSVYEVTQASIKSEFPTIRLGVFKESFSDLAAAAQGAMSELDLETVEALIHDEAAKGPDVFEAFGMKFPAGQVTLWGDILLLGIQLYFLAYLGQLAGKLKPDDPGWDVPWVGMDSSGLSDSIFYASVVVLPFSAAILLGLQATVRLSFGCWERIEGHWYHPIYFLVGPWHWHYDVLIKIFLLIVAAAASGCLGILCWKYRPQIAPEPELPEYPEGLSKKWMLSR